MRNTLLKLYVKSQVLMSTLKEENGQDLVEYALVVALIAFAAVTAMNTLASDINTAFEKIGSKVTSNIS